MICPLCHNKIKYYFFVNNQDKNSSNSVIKYFKCKQCDLLAQNKYQDKNYIYSEEYAPWANSLEKSRLAVEQTKTHYFNKLLTKLEEYKPSHRKLLDVGTGMGYLLLSAKKMQYQVSALDISDYHTKYLKEKFDDVSKSELTMAPWPNNNFSVITMTDYLEHIKNPKQQLKKTYELLDENGLLLITTPNIKSITRKILPKSWWHYKDEHLIFWSKKSLTKLLTESNFSILQIKNNIKTISLGYLYNYFQKYNFLFIDKIITFIYNNVPTKLKNITLPNFLSGELLVIAKKNE